MLLKKKLIKEKYKFVRKKKNYKGQLILCSDYCTYTKSACFNIRRLNIPCGIHLCGPKILWRETEQLLYFYGNS